MRGCSPCSMPSMPAGLARSVGAISSAGSSSTPRRFSPPTRPRGSFIWCATRGRLAELLHAGRRPGVAGWETQQWRQSMRLAVDNHEKYPRRYQVVRYEDLRGDTERIMREVWAFLGEDDVLTSRSDATLWGSEAQPAMDARLIAYVERHAAAEMTGLGYVPVRPILSQRERFLLNFIDAPINRIGLAARGFRRANDRARVERTARSRGVAVHG